MANISLINFNSGELSPLIDTRSDVEKYAGGCRTLLNMLPRIYGCAERRPGTEYIATDKDSSKKIKLVPFQYSDTIAYVCEFGESYIRFFYDGAVLTGSTATPDDWLRYNEYEMGQLVTYSSVIYRNLIGSGWKNKIVSHWKLDENAASQSVVDSVGSFDGVATVNTSTLSTAGIAGTTEGTVFDFDGQYAVEIDDNSNYSFGDDVNDSPCSFGATVYVTDTGANQVILSKWDNDAREWILTIQSNEKFRVQFYDESVNDGIYRTTNDALTAGYHIIFATYDGTGSADGITLYVDGSEVDSTGSTGDSYVAMENLTPKVIIGARNVAGILRDYFADKMDNIVIFNKKLSSAEVTAISTKPDINFTDWIATDPDDEYPICETPSPYQEGDLFELQFRQSADVMWIVHPNYAPRKLSRTTPTSFELSTIDFANGPFLPRNDLKNNDGVTITPSATTGNITLTASSAVFDSAHTSSPGALFKIRHPRAVTETEGKHEHGDDIDPGIIGSAVDVKGTFAFNTHGTWTKTVKLQRNENSEGWETYRTYPGKNDRQIQYAGTESADNVQYRINVTSSSSGTLEADITINNSVEDGIARITGTASTVSSDGLYKVVDATVLTDFASTDASKRWWEGAWSAHRGYPSAFAFFEERGVYAGTAFEPQNVWLSASGDFEDFETGVNDADPFTLTLSSDEANQIRWASALEALVLGTIGGEWRIRATALDEALTPTNFNLRQQSTRGSKKIQPIPVGTAVLFIDYVGRKVREMTFSDVEQKFVTPDLSALAEHITLTGITSVAYQRNPDNILWCTLVDGTLLSMTYERDQNVVAWARHTIGGTDVVVESVAVIPGTSEDEVWISVLRTIDGSDARYIERLTTRVDVDLEDSHFVDSGLAYLGTSSTIIGISSDDPGVVRTSAAHGWSTGDQIYISGVEGMTEVNDKYYTIRVLTSTTFEIREYTGP